MTTNASNAVGSLSRSAWRVPGRASYWVAQLAPFVLALAVYSVAHEVMRPAPTGDEPHYLIAAQSLAFDGDLDLVNDYGSRERTMTAFGGSPLPGSPHRGLPRYGPASPDPRHWHGGIACSCGGSGRAQGRARC